jgi:branched-chain amino acid transport system substrate-binding protein
MNNSARTARRRLHRALATGVALGGLVALFAPSCSLVIDASATQCTKDADCKAFPGATCKSGTCVGGGGDQCAKNADCSAMGDYYVCRQSSPRQCVQLTSADCPTVVGDYKDDNAVFFGLIADLASDTGASILNGATLGVEDLNALKLPPKPGSSASRPVVLVACTDQSDKTNGERVAKHMVEDLGLQAICGAAYSGITLGIAGDVTIPDDVLLMSSSATSTLITDYEKRDPKCMAACGADTGCQAQCVPILWRTSPSDKIQSAAIAAYFKDRYENEVRVDLGTMSMPFAGQLKVAVAFKGDAYGQGLKEALEQVLQFNGQSALSQLDTNYKAFNYGNPDDTQSSPLKYNETVVALTQFQPDIILAFGTDEAVHEPDPGNPTGAGIFKRVEATWTGATKPHWLFSDGGLIPSLSDEAQVAGALSRVRGTIPGTDNLNFQAFVSQYSSRFSSETLGSAQTFGAAGAYDIMYLFSYSAVAAQSNPLTGPQIAKGFSRMVGGATKIKVGKTGINQAFQILSTADGAFDFDGASGPLDFDLKTGEAVSDIQIWCLPKPDGMGKVATGFPSGVSYQGVQGNIIGALKTTCSGQ